MYSNSLYGILQVELSLSINILLLYIATIFVLVKVVSIVLYLEESICIYVVMHTSLWETLH